MEPFYERLMVRAATIDELLSDAYEQLPGERADSELAARRLAAWCRSSASGDWSLFAQRLERDGLSFADVLGRFATARPNGSLPAPEWIDDAAWICAALRGIPNTAATAREPEVEPCAFEDLLTPVVLEAEKLLWSGVDADARSNLCEGAHESLRRSLLVELSNLSAPAIYERLAIMRKDAVAYLDLAAARSTVHYDQFISEVRADGFRRLFEDKPVLLRLMASITRQWIGASRELITRLDTDLPAIRGDLLPADARCRVTRIDGDLSDPHNFGRTVQILSFEDGSRLVYKPKDLGVDAAWHALIERLNRTAPLDLRATRVLPRSDYGWTEFVDHTSCTDLQGLPRSFRRAGAWLALFHCFVGVDMHQENIIAAGEHPVPIDLEMILQADDARAGLLNAGDTTGQAIEAAMENVNNSVMTVGLLPAYARYLNSKIFAIGGVTSNSTPRVKLTWAGMNSDTMRPVKAADNATTISNLPNVDGQYARLGDYVDDFMAGFDDYAAFLRRQRPADLFEAFAGLTVRRVVRPTRFYYMLIQRLRDHRTMDDGILWSAQADFAARLADWEHDRDPTWPLQRAERAAVVDLNVPHFVMACDGHEIRDAAGTAIAAAGTSGLERASARVHGLDDGEIAWQAEVIRQSTAPLRRAKPAASEHNRLRFADTTNMPGPEVFTVEADAAARTLAEHAVRRGRSAAWVGLDWLGDSELSQLVVLGPDLYNGACGIALFLAAHSVVTNTESSRALALAALTPLRAALQGRHPARTARSLGVGGGLGMGSIVYAFAVIAELLDDHDLLSDAQRAAQLITDDVISADRQLDVLGGSAGAILGLLRLYRQTGSGDALTCATQCGHHLLAQPRVQVQGGQSRAATGFGKALNGMSHGAAGFAYALSSLASATGNGEFASAAAECITFENSTFDAEHDNWADRSGADRAYWHCKWCHGAPGIGLARVAMSRHAAMPGTILHADIERALAGVQRGWPVPTDTLCCGTLGSIEFLWEAGDLLNRGDLRELATCRLRDVVHTARSTGDYTWTNGTRRFNLGFFRGIAGVGYTALRRLDASLPNVLIWQ